jgi:hypothetical protein
MGIRGEIFSTKVQFKNRTYFFNVKENRMGDLYLNIVESKNKENSGFERQSIVLFADDLQEFLTGFDESLKVLEKAVREKKRAAPRKREDGRGKREEGKGERGMGNRERGAHTESGERGVRAEGGERRSRAEGDERKPRRVVKVRAKKYEE